jgi:hypothetical protein
MTLKIAHKVWEGGLVGLALLAWVCVLLVGILVPSGPYREAIRSAPLGTLVDMAGYAGVVFASYTVSNLLVLCVLASLLGALGRQVQLGPSDDDVPLDVSSPYISAVIRGFFLYLAVVSGVIVMSDNALVNPTQDIYLRTAGFLSLFAFASSYNPSIFRSLFRWVGDRVPAAKHEGGTVATHGGVRGGALEDAPRGNGAARPGGDSPLGPPAHTP